eukprot:5091349-Amphidinium_carterae.1
MRIVEVTLSTLFTNLVRQGCQVAWNMPNAKMIPLKSSTCTPTLPLTAAGTKQMIKFRIKSNMP